MRSSNSSRPRLTRARRGLTLTEVAVAAALVAALTPVVARFSAAVATRERATERRVAAMQVLEAALERVTVREWEETAPARIEPPEPPAALAQRVPGAELTVDARDGEFGRRVTASITWRDPTGQRAGPLRLSAWVYPREELTP